MAKPKKIVLKSDSDKKFGAEVFDLIRTALTPKVGGNVNLGVKLAAEHFAPRKPATVTVVELETAISEIAKKFEAESGRKSDNDGRLPLNDEAQKLWDSGQWKGKLTVHGLRQRYAAEIKDGVDLTLSMLDAYTAELAVEKAKIAELVDEHDDPDAPAKFPCGVPSHRGENEPLKLQGRNLLFRNDAGELARMRHAKGDGGEIIAGDVFVLTTSGAEEFNSREKDPAKHIVLTEAEIAEGGRRTIFCKNCRMAALDEGREEGFKLTFYTWAGAQRVLDATKKSAEGKEQTSNLLRAAAARVFDSRGTRRDRARPDWRRNRGQR
ncbi:hypothetical protein A2819_02075 [Candidatus Azambacteria bacterium RIFCSPHIGHO2_01_FULL_40_24]|uniref:Uncharacterized protein n=1 Tax=Candidatus Azambacteria bacterium RIFCSPHIGHO2_01_FULL_40_24 TaxID=1797301 RepID=A0A1F5B4J1_9BACT|nr:MAG: hypothetical protein A2819_02075 [Candidatus Azambacteria bacterium RIFCSPHIGHO2_01_FULL_40_24]